MAAPRLPGALGFLDSVDVTESLVGVTGWIVHPQIAIDGVRVLIDGERLGEAALHDRPDVGASIGPVPHATRSGFRVVGDVAGVPGRKLRIEIVGLAQGRERVSLRMFWPGQETVGIAAPDADLRERVSSKRDEASFRTDGYTIAGQLLAEVRESLPGASAPRLLDWGCGSGRATRYFHLFWPELRVTGCDIDAAAIAWCGAHIADARFDATGPFPPLPYAAGSFDAVVASSVMTHLAGDVQISWLREIRRVLAPGGVFVASVHGSLASVYLPPSLRDLLARDGMIDQNRDAALDGVAPPDYYRTTYQTEAVTRRRWGRVMPVVAYHEGGLANFQDIVVMRRDGGIRALARLLSRAAP